MTSEALANHDCPLCGGANDCALARSGRVDVPCWCESATFGAALLARVPQPLRGTACVCVGCASAAGPHRRR